MRTLAGLVSRLFLEMTVGFAYSISVSVFLSFFSVPGESEVIFLSSIVELLAEVFLSAPIRSRPLFAGMGRRLTS